MNNKCSGPNCNVKYIKNNYIFSPHLCELCDKYFCFNCMYLTCNICHLSYTCYWCGQHKKSEKNYIQKCKKHINTILEKCEQKNCSCKINT
jgi:hypothetical protein